MNVLCFISLHSSVRFMNVARQVHAKDTGHQTVGQVMGSAGRMSLQKAPMLARSLSSLPRLPLTKPTPAVPVLEAQRTRMV
jgi:hypothetical protein